MNTHYPHAVRVTVGSFRDHQDLVRWCYNKGITLADFCTTNDGQGEMFCFHNEEDALYFALSNGF